MISWLDQLRLWLDFVLDVIKIHFVSNYKWISFQIDIKAKKLGSVLMNFKYLTHLEVVVVQVKLVIDKESQVFSADSEVLLIFLLQTDNREWARYINLPFELRTKYVFANTSYDISCAAFTFDLSVQHFFIHFFQILQGSSIFAHLLDEPDSGETIPNPTFMYRQQKLGLDSFPKNELRELGEPYIWVQSLAGLIFPRFCATATIDEEPTDEMNSKVDETICQSKVTSCPDISSRFEAYVVHSFVAKPNPVI